MIFDETNSIMFCPIEKVACSTWTAVMANNSKSSYKVGLDLLFKANYIHENLNKFDRLKKKKFERNIHQNFKKFLIVRNPLDRLVSAYHDKAYPSWFDGKPYFYYYSPIRNFALKNFPHSNLSNFEREWYNATFTEFVHYILSHDDVHWDSMQRYCDPCHIDYDYILRYESMERDSKNLMRNLYPNAALTI